MRVMCSSEHDFANGSGELSGAGLAPATIVKAVQVFNKVIRAAVEDRIIAHNPVDKLPVPTIPRDEMRFLTPDEPWRLADTIDPRYRGLVLLGGYGGLCIGEMLALRWQNVDRTESRVSRTPERCQQRHRPGRITGSLQQEPGQPPRRSRTSDGSTIAASTASSATCHPPSSKPLLPSAPTRSTNPNTYSVLMQSAARSQR
jgi:hypothetical protein